MKPNLVMVIILSCCALVFHSWILFILYRRKYIRNHRFLWLFLCLSLSDAFVALECVLHALFSHLADGSDRLSYSCRIIINLIGGSFAFSLFQTLQICLFQLHSTFVKKYRAVTLATSFKATIIGSIFIHLFAVLKSVISRIIQLQQQPCGLLETVQLPYFFIFDMLILFLVALIVICCCITKIRFQQHIQRIRESAIPNTQNKISTLKKNSLTTFSVVCVVMLAYIPREIYVIMIHASGNSHNDQIIEWLSVGFLLNPLVDPVLFLFRAKALRREFTTKCANGNSIGHSDTGRTQTVQKEENRKIKSLMSQENKEKTIVVGAPHCSHFQREETPKTLRKPSKLFPRDVENRKMKTLMSQENKEKVAVVGAHCSFKREDTPKTLDDPSNLFNQAVENRKMKTLMSQENKAKVAVVGTHCSHFQRNETPTPHHEQSKLFTRDVDNRKMKTLMSKENTEKVAVDGAHCSFKRKKTSKTLHEPPKLFIRAVDNRKMKTLMSKENTEKVAVDGAHCSCFQREETTKVLDEPSKLFSRPVENRKMKTLMSQENKEKIAVVGAHCSFKHEETLKKLHEPSKLFSRGKSNVTPGQEPSQTSSYHIFTIH